MTSLFDALGIQAGLGPVTIRWQRPACHEPLDSIIALQLPQGADDLLEPHTEFGPESFLCHWTSSSGEDLDDAVFHGIERWVLLDERQDLQVRRSVDAQDQLDWIGPGRVPVLDDHLEVRLLSSEVEVRIPPGIKVGATPETQARLGALRTGLPRMVDDQDCDVLLPLKLRR